MIASHRRQWPFMRWVASARVITWHSPVCRQVRAHIVSRCLTRPSVAGYPKCRTWQRRRQCQLNNIWKRTPYKLCFWFRARVFPGVGFQTLKDPTTPQQSQVTLLHLSQYAPVGWPSDLAEFASLVHRYVSVSRPNTGRGRHAPCGHAPEGAG
jgi:hypothetical protein